jgi:CRISPR-associated endonuclease/helicase Cas3
VAEKAKELAKALNLSEELCDIVYVAGLCHDIGKADNGFQEYIKNKSDETYGDDIIEDDAKYALHNEIGWAYLCKKGFRYKSKSEIKNSNIGNLILNAVYWHHGAISHKHLDDYKDVGSILKDVDENFTEFNQISKELGISKYCAGYEGTNSAGKPNYIEPKPDRKHYNALQFIIRACVVNADRYISAKENGKQIETYNEINPIRETDIKSPNNYDTKRFNDTFEIAKQALKAPITQINAPAGLGKTMVGVLAHALKGGHTYWVVPRNTIAESLYESVNEEIKALGFNIGVELFLTGEVKKTIGKPSITITNIDNLMSPITTMKRAEMAYNVFKDTVIFDEYHEFAQKENGIYSAFINIMIARGSFVNGNTILLSATPSIHNEIWDSIICATTEKECKTQILPNKDKFYNAAHNKTYSINVSNDFFEGNDTLSVYNSVKNVQDKWLSQKDCKLFHSRYTAEHKYKLLQGLLGEHGKNSKDTKSQWIASPILQASIDISFNTLNEVILSPESTMQRIGRCNRWGRNEKASIIIDCGEDKSNISAIDILYDKKLNAKWHNFVKTNFIGNKTLDEIYELYGKFNEKNKEELLTYYKELYDSSTRALSALIPLKHHSKAQKDENMRIVASKNPTLRSLCPNLFYTIRDKETGKWLSEPLTMPKRELEKLHKNEQQIDKLRGYPKHIINNLTKTGYLGYEKISKSFPMREKYKNKKYALNEDLIKKCYYSDTPYPVVTLEYAFSKDENGDRRGIIENEA